MSYKYIYPYDYVEVHSGFPDTAYGCGSKCIYSNSDTEATLQKFSSLDNEGLGDKILNYGFLYFKPISVVTGENEDKRLRFYKENATYSCTTVTWNDYDDFPTPTEIMSDSYLLKEGEWQSKYITKDEISLFNKTSYTSTSMYPLESVYIEDFEIEVYIDYEETTQFCGRNCRDLGR